MYRKVTLLLVTLLLAALAFAQSPADKEKAAQYLNSTRQGVIDATKGLSEAQWNFKPAPDRWSIAEIVEHIAATEDMLRDTVVEQVMKAPAQPAGDDVHATDAQVMKVLPDRTHKLQAPEPLRPTNRYGSPEASLKHFLETRQQMIDFLNSHDDLRTHAIDSPLGKKLDGYEWILFMAGHSERHTKQILEVKADPNFPKQ